MRSGGPAKVPAPLLIEGGEVRPVEGRRVGIVDVGTHSALFLLIEFRGMEKGWGWSEILDSIAVTGLGEGVACTGSPGRGAVSRTVHAIKGFKSLCEKNGGEYFLLFGTEVFRRMKGGEGVAERISSETGGELSILREEDEACLTYSGVLSSLEIEGGETGRRAVVDVGGGSTEFMYGRGERLESIEKFPGLGSLFLRDRFGLIPPVGREKIERARGEVKRLLRGMTPASKRAARPPILSGGTATTLASMKIGLDTYNPVRIEGTPLDIPFLKKVQRWAEDLPLKEFSKLRGLSPDRASVIPAGAIILEEIIGGVRIMGDPIVTTRGLRHGVAELLISSRRGG